MISESFIHFESSPVQAIKSNTRLPLAGMPLSKCRQCTAACNPPAKDCSEKVVTLPCDSGHRLVVVQGLHLLTDQILSGKEDDSMFARIVRMNLKPGAGKGFARAIDDEIIPALRKYSGFTGEIAMVSSDGKEAIGISIWDNREHAEEYNRRGFAGVLKALEAHLEGKSDLRTFEVTNSTFEKLPIRKAA